MLEDKQNHFSNCGSWVRKLYNFLKDGHCFSNKFFRGNKDCPNPSKIILKEGWGGKSNKLSPKAIFSRFRDYHHSDRPETFWGGVFFFLIFCVFSLGIVSAEETFPFVAEVTAPDVNIRAGQHLNFENIGRLSKGAQVIVVGKDYSWYKVKLPRDAKSYISQDYLQVLSDSSGLVTANRVNIRAGQGSNFTALGQVSKGTVVKILEKLPGWYRIEPMEGTYGWLSVQYLIFKSNQVPAIENVKAVIQKAPESSASSIEKISVNEKSISVVPAEIKQVSSTEKVVSLAQGGNIFLRGIVEALEEKKSSGDIRHRITTDDHSIYLLEGYKKAVDEFVSYQVTIDGKIKQDPQHLYPYPVIVVSRINLVL